MTRVTVPTALTALTALALAALTLTGCSASDGAAPAVVAAATTAAPAATPSPTPTVMSTEDAGRRYLELVGPGNKALNKVNDDVVGKRDTDMGSLKTAKAHAKRLADELAVQLRGFADPSVWPKTVRKQIETMSELAAADLSHARAMTKAKTKGDFIDLWNDFADTRDGGSTAQLIRARLGLPEVPQ